METTLMEERETLETTRKCPFCAEDIKKAAIKCRHCGEFLDIATRLSPKKKWYHTNIAIIISLLTLGPLALPMVWVHPKYNLTTKLAITVGIVAVTMSLCYATVALYSYLLDQIRLLGI